MKSLKEFILETTLVTKNTNVATTETPTEKPTEKATEAPTEKPTEEPAEKTPVEDKKIVTFDFTDLEESKDTIKQIEELDNINGVAVTIEGDKITFEINKNVVEKIDELHTIISDYVNKLKHSSKRYSDESYAQKIKKFSKVLMDLDNYIEDVKGSEEE